MHIVEFCLSNSYHGTEEYKSKLELLPDVEVIEYGCLGNCGECYLSPYALVNGETVVAATAEELYALILAELERHQAERDALDKLADGL